MLEIKKYNVVFLIDKAPPTKVILLKRATTKEYAPNYYTGIGGKIGDIQGLEDETPLESAYRELNEETQGNLSKGNILLTEFARCIYDDGLTIFYFFGIYNKTDLPKMDPNDGNLSWISTDNLLEEQIIPTTKAVCEEWAKRKFKTDSQFSVYLKHSGMSGTVRLVKKIEVMEGLQ